MVLSISCLIHVHCEYEFCVSDPAVCMCSVRSVTLVSGFAFYGKQPDLIG